MFYIGVKEDSTTSRKEHGGCMGSVSDKEGNNQRLLAGNRQKENNGNVKLAIEGVST